MKHLATPALRPTLSYRLQLVYVGAHAYGARRSAHFAKEIFVMCKSLEGDVIQRLRQYIERFFLSRRSDKLRPAVPDLPACAPGKTASIPLAEINKGAVSGVEMQAVI